MMIFSSAPGRVDFLNTHQDYKGLPTVPIAIDKRVRMKARPREDSIICATSKSVHSEEAYDQFSSERPEYKKRPWWGNYLRAVVNPLADISKKRLRGLDVTIDSDLPIASGLASSAALEVAFAGLMIRANDLEMDAKTIAEICYRAERLELGIPCGRLDQYSSAFGGVILLENRPPFNVEELPKPPGSIVIIDSGIKHSTASIHPIRQSELDLGISQLYEAGWPGDGVERNFIPKHNELIWEKVDLPSLDNFLMSIDKTCSKRIKFTILMQRSTTIAIQLLKGEAFDKKSFEEALDRDRALPTDRLEIIAEILNYQHELLRDLYEVSHPKLESLRELALSEGAMGVKISGAGMGGSMVAITKYDDADRCVERIREVGAWATLVRVDEGVKSTLKL
ncbi:MAG: GHMP family kinase ATP-binding protein [Thermoproteota archaeon]